MENAPALPVLYHAPSSYYSMIARLALAEGGVAYAPARMDIHARLMQQRPDYARLNPNMTVPTLVLPDRVLTESREIAMFALGADEAGRYWVDLQYSLPVEELTFGRVLAKSPVARVMIPKILARARRRLLGLAAANPDLAGLYEARAAVFAERIRVFDPAAAARLAERRQAQAVAICDEMARALADGRAVLSPPRYGVADVVMSVLLARMEFTGLGGEIAARPALAAYWRTMQDRPGFKAADVWTRVYVGRMVRGVLEG